MILTKEYLEEQKDCVKRNYQMRLGAKDNPYVKSIIEFCKGAKTILDVGCGSFMPVIIGATYACDVVDTPRKYLSDQGWKGDFVKCSCDCLPFGPFTFDVAVCSEVIEHLPDLEAARNTIEELNRVARRWILTTPVSRTFGKKEKFNVERTHKLFFDKKSLEWTKKYGNVKIYVAGVNLIVEKW